MSNASNKPIYIYKRFRVKRADGGSTTVSIDPALVVLACKSLGSLSTVSRIVREAAATFVESESNAARNRSSHVARTLQAVIDNKAQSATTQVAQPVAVVPGAEEGFIDIAASSAA